MIDVLGWTATALVVMSYFCRRPNMLRGCQIAGAVLWTIYGVTIGSSPVIVANILVCSAATWTTVRPARTRSKGLVL